MNIKTGDTVVVLSGDDKGTKGKVIAVSPKEGKVLVEKVNMIHKHVKARKQGVRVKHVVKDGKKIRVCAKCGKAL